MIYYFYEKYYQNYNPVYNSILRTLLCACIALISTPIYSQINVQTDMLSAYYEVGESMTFNVSSEVEGTVYYEIRETRRHYVEADFIPPLTSGELELQAGDTQEISFTLDEPGSVFCYVSNSADFENAQKVGAVFSPLEIVQSTEDASDFQEFWNEKKAQLADVEIDPQFETYDIETNTDRINLGMIDGRRVYGYISYPEGISQNDVSGELYPALVTISAHGSGPNTCIPKVPAYLNTGVISLSIWIHNAEPDTYSEEAYTPNDITDRDLNYYRYGVLSVVRAIDYLASRTDVDDSKIMVNGVSEGGGMALLASGVDERINCLMVSNLALAAHDGILAEHGSGFPWWGWQSQIAEYDTDLVINESKYYDAARAIQFFEGSLLHFIAYNDDIVHPSSNFTAYNRHRGQSTLLHRPLTGHSHNEFFVEYPRFMKYYLNAYDFADELVHHIGAGEDITLTDVSENAELVATILERGEVSNDWQVSWDKMEGVGDVSFSNAQSLTTTVSFTESGTYYLRVTGEKNFSGTGSNDIHEGFHKYHIRDIVKVVVEDGTSTDEVEKDLFSFYPNPTEDKLYIELAAPTNYTANIMNLTGQVIKSIELNNHTNTIDLENIVTGVYFLEIIAKETNIRQVQRFEVIR